MEHQKCKNKIKLKNEKAKCTLREDEQFLLRKSMLYQDTALKPTDKKNLQIETKNLTQKIKSYLKPIISSH